MHIVFITAAFILVGSPQVFAQEDEIPDDVNGVPVNQYEPKDGKIERVLLASHRTKLAGIYTLVGGFMAGYIVWDAKNTGPFCEEDCDRVGRYGRHMDLNFEFECDRDPRRCRAIQNSGKYRLFTYPVGLLMTIVGARKENKLETEWANDRKPWQEAKRIGYLSLAGAGSLAAGMILRSRLETINRRIGMGEHWPPARAHGKRISAGVAAGTMIYGGSVAIFHSIVNSIGRGVDRENNVQASLWSVDSGFGVDLGYKF